MPFSRMIESEIFVRKAVLVDCTYMVTGLAKTIPNGTRIEIQFITEH